MAPTIRPAAVAGLFYPASTAALVHEVEQLLRGVAQTPSTDFPKAIIAPHAGYVYSGPIAASVYARFEAARSIIRRVVVLGPTHRVAVDGIALPASGEFSTPRGNVLIDQRAVAAIEHLPQVQVLDAAHRLEHAIEVQLPFLQAILDHFSLLPLAVGNASAECIAEVLERVWGGEETLIVVSSDLSHYLPYAEASARDANTAQRILQLDSTIDHQDACGASPINGLLRAARQHNLIPELIDLRNSGDTVGDRLRVVGYAAFAFNEKEHHAH